MSINKIYSQLSLKSKTDLVLPIKTKSKKATNWLLLGFGLGAIAVFSATAGALLALSLSKTPLSQVNLTPKEESVFSNEETISYSNLKIPELSRPVNILVLGIKVITSDLDEKPTEDLGYHALVNSFDGLADTMLLLRFDPIQNKLTVLSIPRDTKTEIEGHGLRKINDANHYGGPALAAQTVSNLLEGVTIDRYVRVNVQGIEKLIDALGGVNFYVPKDMKYTDFSQHLYINLKEGQQHLNGDQAIQFLRFRYDNYGDIGRIQRQQGLIRAVIEQALSPKTIVKIPEILSVIQSHLDTNLTINELIALSAFAGQKNRSDVKMLMLPGDFNIPEKNELSYWLPNPAQIKEMMVKHFNVEPTYDVYDNYANSSENQKDLSTLKIAIQDTTNNPEAVQAMINHLNELGYRGAFFTRHTYHKSLSTTKIVAQNGDDATAAEVRANLGLGEVLVESTGTLGSDITIEIGEDWAKQQLIQNNNSSEQLKTNSY